MILTAHIATRRGEDACLILSLPLFIAVLCLTRLLVAGLESIEIAALRPLLLLQFLMLGLAFILCIPSGAHSDAAPLSIVVAGQLSVAAMAVQNALGQLSFAGAPSSAVMTTNLTRFIVDAGEALLGKEGHESAEARRRANETWPVIIGFTAGAGLGAACFSLAGLKSLGLPAGLALLAMFMSLPGGNSVDLNYRKAKEGVE